MLFGGVRLNLEIYHSPYGKLVIYHLSKNIFMRFYTLIGLIVIISSCQIKNENINGDWVSEKDIAGDPNKRPVFSFQDSICKLYTPWNVDTKYSVNGETINIYESTEVGPTNFINEFKIIKLDDDSLIISKNNIEKRATEIIRLKKLKPQNSIHPSKIYFASSDCFGTCPSMFLEIDSLGKIMFYGRYHTDSIGFFTSQLSIEEYNLLLKKIQNIKLNSLHIRYEADWTDDQTSGINIIYDKKKLLSSVYGYDKEPIELRILLNYLIDLYKHIHLKKDSFINEKYIVQNKEFNKLIKEVRPPLPPTW